jgi:hypothetical protein
MSLFSFFKRKQKIEEPKPNSYNIEDLPKLIDEEIRKIKDKSEKFKNELKEMIDSLSLEVKQKIPELKKLNLDKRKEDQKLKEIVLANVSFYISALERFIKDLEKIDTKEETEKYIKEIQFTFNYFNKSSRMNYERATILIGKELAEVRYRIDNFAKEFNEKLRINNEDFEKIKLIKILQNSLKELKETQEVQKQIDDSIINFEGKIVKTEEEIKIFENDYEKYKKSNESKKFLEEQEKIKEDNKIINEEILKLKQEFDFKGLAKYFHEDRKKSQMIKNYSENFLNSLKQDDNFNIIMLLKEANHSINEEKIKELRKKIIEQKVPSSDKMLKGFEDKTEKANQELKHERDELEHEKIKKQKFEYNKKQILKKVEDEAKKIWPEIKINPQPI